MVRQAIVRDTHATFGLGPDLHGRRLISTRPLASCLMWLAAAFIALGLFVLAGVLLARSQTHYLRLYRELHGSETFPWADDQPWRWQRDGRVEASLFDVFSTHQDTPELERRRLTARRWQLATLGVLALTFVLGLASQRF